MGMQYMLTGVAAGHGPFEVTAVNTPVEICGMEVQSGDVIHMDENGAVKFPMDYLDQVLERLELIARREAECQMKMRQADNIEAVADIQAAVFRY